jgi:hypothetical protein
MNQVFEREWFSAIRSHGFVGPMFYTENRTWRNGSEINLSQHGQITTSDPAGTSIVAPESPK